MEQDQELLPPPVPPRITVQIQVAGRLSHRTAVCTGRALGPPSSASPAATLTPARPTGPSRVCRDRSRISRSAGWRGFPRPRRPALGQHPLRGGVSAVISRPGMRDANWMYQQRSASPADRPTHAEYAVGRSQVSPASGGTGAHASILVTKYIIHKC